MSLKSNKPLLFEGVTIVSLVLIFMLYCQLSFFLHISTKIVFQLSLTNKLHLLHSDSGKHNTTQNVINDNII